MRLIGFVTFQSKRQRTIAQDSSPGCVMFRTLAQNALSGLTTQSADGGVLGGVVLGLPCLAVQWGPVALAPSPPHGRRPLATMLKNKCRHPPPMSFA